MKENCRVRKIKKYTSIFESKITHQESRLAKSISKVLYVLDQNNKLNTSQIKLETELCWDSVIKSLQILVKKKIVIISTFKNKKNNEKKYSIIKDKAICYHEHLSQWKHRHTYKKQMKQMIGITKIDIKYEKILPENWLKTEIILSKKDQLRFHITKKYAKIEEFPVVQARELGDQYIANELCFECFEKKKISIVKIIPYDEGLQNENWLSICTNCGNEIKYDPNVRLDQKTINSRASMQKYNIVKQFKKIKNEYDENHKKDKKERKDSLFFV